MVLERIARGAGSTRWYRVTKTSDLESLYKRLAPASIVSFYFDERFASIEWGDEAIVRVLDLVAARGEAVVGSLCADDLELSVQFVAGANELNEFAEGLVLGAQLFVGEFPAADNDGYDAVTVALPDRDGVVRGHPH